jgi:SAM-dependent methyltransferase
VSGVVSDSSLHAFLYDPWMGVVDRAGMADRRRRLVAEARGRVLEVGGGTGRNLPLYRDVDSVVVLEDNAWMRQRLFPRVKAAAVPVEIHEAPIERTGFEDGSFDTIVCSLVLCRVTSQDEVLAEVRRLLRPDGRLLFLEHVQAPGARGRLQKAVTPAWSRTIGGGCHLDRDTLDAIRGAGFAITDCDRSGVLVQGIARFSTRAADAG